MTSTDEQKTGAIRALNAVSVDEARSMIIQGIEYYLSGPQKPGNVAKIADAVCKAHRVFDVLNPTANLDSWTANIQAREPNATD